MEIMIIKVIYKTNDLCETHSIYLTFHQVQKMASGDFCPPVLRKWYEGDCEFNNECQATLICDTANSCPAYLEFASDVNCCSIGSGCESYDSYF